MTRTAAALAVATVVGAAALAACGGGTAPQQRWQEACTQAAQRMAGLPRTASATPTWVAASAASTNLRDLAARLAGLPNPPDAVDAINLRNATPIVATGFADLAVVLRGAGVGGLPRVITSVTTAYARIDAAARGLGIADCRATALGADRFRAYAGRGTAVPVHQTLTAALAASCHAVTVAYGAQGVAVDRAAAVSQLRRSLQAIDEARRPVASRTEPRARAATADLTHARAVLTRAVATVRAGAAPGPASVAAFRAARPMLRTALPGCAIPG
ncbi:MAG: hypothetical protein U0Y82_10020 [Thermoleophilia bacterium]